MNSFDEITLLHNPLPNINYEDTDLTTRIGELSTSSPLFINGMTGGAHDTKEINRALAKAARHYDIPMAVGSQMAAIKNPDLVETYEVVREENPRGIIFANLGAYASYDQAQQAIEMIAANGIQLHLNVMQELIMPEGDRHFAGILHTIEELVTRLNVPVIVKEVGFGMPREAIEKLIEVGVEVIDVGGVGGTNFAAIENERGQNLYAFLNNWGITTPQSLLEAQDFSEVTLIASGGIRNGLDVVKSLSLGATMTGMAGRFLHVLIQDGEQALMDLIEDLHHQIRLIMTATGAQRIKDLQRIPLLFKGELFQWASLREIDLKRYSGRKYIYEW